MITIDLARSRATYARLRAPDWLLDPLIVPMSMHGHAMVENAVAALRAYRTANRVARIGLADGTEHVGWVEGLHVVRDPDPDGEGSSGAVLIGTEEGATVAIDLTEVRRIDECEALADYI